MSGKRLRGMYRHLGGGDWEEANLALRVLTATASRGPEHASALLRALDWDHKTLAKLSKPARCGLQGAGLLLSLRSSVSPCGCTWQ
jgi:Ribosome 60S biogenesis N-terminal